MWKIFVGFYDVYFLWFLSHEFMIYTVSQENGFLKSINSSQINVFQYLVVYRNLRKFRSVNF